MINNQKWLIDKQTYTNLQKLKQFTNYISKLKYTTQEQKIQIKEINYQIENINNPNFYKDWNICIDIFDNEIQSRTTDREGIYWKTWSIFFEDESIEIKAESHHSEYHLGHYGNDFHYFGNIYFGKTTNRQQIYMETNIEEFINDAINFRNYITETLNDIIIDIDISN